MLKKIQANLPLILKIGIYLALFTSLLYVYSDKDWGWHYRYGQYFLETGHLLIRDIYSWTLATYAWINHSWLFDPILYTLFNRVGYLGLSLIGGGLALLAFHLLTAKFKLNYWQLGLAAIFFSKLIETGIREGLRSQSLALLPMATLMYLLEKGRSRPKWLWLIPPLFLLWVNLHGTFAFGMAILGVFLAVYFWQYPVLRKQLFWVGLLAFLATLFNPFTYHSYLEVLRHTSSPYLQNVFEWIPIYRDCPDCHVPTFGLYLVVLVLAALVKPKKQELPYFIVALALVYQTIMARRYLPLFLFSTFPLFLSFLTRLKSRWLDLGNYHLTPYFVTIATLIVIEANLFTRLPSYNYYHYTERDYCLYASLCSLNVLDYLKINPPSGNGFNFYDWGGYLIGKGFSAKVFVDGRMHLWSVRDYSPFGDYLKMYYYQDKDLFLAYDFNWVLVPPGSEAAKMIEGGLVGRWNLSFHDEFARYYVRVR